MTNAAANQKSATPGGIVLHAAAGYDLLLWLITLGRERAFREKMLRHALLQPGESVLDVGCGAGTLAIAAKRQVGPAGEVCGLDASPQMLARAEKKARASGLRISFRNGFAQSLPFPAGRFDLVLSTVMLHHLPKNARTEMAAEVRRVLKPGGRALVIDFCASGRNGKTLLDRLHRPHEHVELKEVIDLLHSAGLTISDSRPLGMRDLHFVLAKAPCCA